MIERIRIAAWSHRRILRVLWWQWLIVACLLILGRLPSGHVEVICETVSCVVGALSLFLLLTMKVPE